MPPSLEGRFWWLAHFEASEHFYPLVELVMTLLTPNSEWATIGLCVCRLIRTALFLWRPITVFPRFPRGECQESVRAFIHGAPGISPRALVDNWWYTLFDPEFRNQIGCDYGLHFWQVLFFRDTSVLFNVLHPQFANNYQLAQAFWVQPPMRTFITVLSVFIWQPIKWCLFCHS
jgi:hypothetical protein